MFLVIVKTDITQIIPINHFIYLKLATALIILFSLKSYISVSNKNHKGLLS